jgi:hypothetical protein
MSSTVPYRLVQVPLSLVQLGFVGWLVAASSPIVWLTVPNLLAMVAGLTVALRRVLRTALDGQRASGMLLRGVLGVYPGWSTAAVCINTATVLPDAAFEGTAGVWLQSGFVLVAGGAAAVGADVFEGRAAYVLTAGWTLAGVLVSAVMADLVLLAAGATTGLLTTRRIRHPGAGRRAGRLR